MQNRVHGFHHVSNNKLPQSNTAMQDSYKNKQRYLIRYQGHGTFKLNRGQPWFNLNVPWQARVYEICTLEFSFEVRWFHGTFIDIFLPSVLCQNLA